MGFVRSNSMVPNRISSEKLRIQTAGTRKRKIHGTNRKYASSEACPASKIFIPPDSSGINHKNKKVKTKKIPSDKYPIRECKKMRMSLRKIRITGSKFRKFTFPLPQKFPSFFPFPSKVRKAQMNNTHEHPVRCSS